MCGFIIIIIIIITIIMTLVQDKMNKFGMKINMLNFFPESRCYMWVEFVVGSRPCSQKLLRILFYSGFSGFPLFLKN